MVRPIVLVFQEFAEITVTPTTPDLNCMVIGPAYQIQDYPDDATDIQVSDYGTYQADNPYTPPVAFTPEISLAAPPNITSGAWVDPTSVGVIFDDCEVIMASGADGVTAADDNYMTSATATFETDGIQAGDVLIVDDPTGPTPNLVLTITSVESETEVRVTSNFTAIGAALKYRIERKLDDQEIDASFINTPTFRASNAMDILGGVTIVVAGVSRTVSYSKVYVEYRAYRTDLQGVDTVQDTDEIESKLGRIDARNPLAVGCSVAKSNAGNAPIQFYGVETQDTTGYGKARDAISSEDDVYAVCPLILSNAILASFKTAHENLADPDQALATGVPQKFRVVIGAGELPVEEDVVDEVTTGTTEQTSGAIPPGTKGISIASLTALSTNLLPGDQLILSASENVAPLDGAYTIAHINSETDLELDEALPVVVGAAEGVNYTVTRPSTGATIVALVDNRAALTSPEAVTFTSRVAGITPGARTVELEDDATTPGGINEIVEIAGVSTKVSLDLTAGTITAQEVVDAVNSGTGVTVAFSGSVNVVASSATPATLQTPASVWGPLALSTGTAGVDDLNNTSILDAVYNKLFDSAATFITDGVLPGDLIEIPDNPNGVYGSDVKQFEVNQVLSEQRLEIANVSGGSYTNNTSTVENELPHTDNRLGTGSLVTQGSIRYRVVRELSKDQQVTDLIAEAQSLNSRRALKVWPDTWTVSGLVDNSLPKNSDGTSAAAVPQPGYYGACVVGGMTAGLPSHQGFSRLGIAGIDSISNSSDYFSEAQLTDLSDGGWYVFKQDSPNALPYSIHQLTTDPSTLESGEYSVVKNFDFVSLYFLDVLEPFLGVWNVNNDTLGFIRQAMNTGIDSLKLRRTARIGAPINDATVTSVAVNETIADRVEVYAEVDLPKPLNVIGLHLIA